MNLLLYAIPAMGSLSLALVAMSSVSRQDPRLEDSTLPAVDAEPGDGAEDPCVQSWEDLLDLFDRGDTEQIRLQLCRLGSVPHDNTRPVNDQVGDDPIDPRRRTALEPDTETDPQLARPSTLPLEDPSLCIARSAIAFLGGADGTTSDAGADAIVTRLSAIWPPLTDASRDGASGSRVANSLVFETGLGCTAYLMTIERPSARSRDEKDIYYLSALEDGLDLDRSDRSTTNGGHVARDRQAENADGVAPASAKPAHPRSRILHPIAHLHVSIAR